MQLFVEKINNQTKLEKYLKLRYEVFCQEQNVDIKEEIDSYDILNNDNVMHFAIFTDDIAISCARVIINDGLIKIGRVATKREFRNNGLISKIFQHILSYLYYNISSKENKIYLESQLHALPIYQKFGFKEFGDEFLDANILHKKMLRQNISPYLYTQTNKRYYTLDHYFKTLFKNKVGRVMIDAGFTCPNIDGTKSVGGCTFCSTRGSGDFAGKRNTQLISQWDEGLLMLHNKWPKAKAIAYFQAYSNTYSDVDTLESMYNTFINNPNCEGIAIGTRPDCISDEVILLLSRLNKIKPIFLELGLQTINDKTAELFNRGYKTSEFEKTVTLLNKNGIKPIVHIINGLPNDTEIDNINTIKFLNRFQISGIKIHMLHLINKTTLFKQYQLNPFHLLSKDEYIEIVVKQLSILNPNVVVHRLTGDAPMHEFIGPIWTKKKISVLNDIDKRLSELKLHQGIFYEGE